ncbi:Protein MICROTUBULE ORGANIZATION 1 [Cyanidiococcus yangmingshanensis]|uniref:Protein MICROTUBULE ORGANIZATION 1 n=1 Tax=Cyanidiococcus yangmingshanensis TaxID=2690220 RepID=A0A7J7IM27_9RHOD|nr:Protein MICROTUBULE ORGANIZATION 1 [Cyanidiococcus yangmingshanensis]
MADEDQLIEEAKKLPISEQVCHKLWRVREAALRKMRETLAEDGSRPSASEANWLVGAVRDANAAVQLAGLDAVVALCDACTDEAMANAVLRKSGVAVAIGRAIAEKCLAGRPQNRARAVDAAMALVSCDAGDELVGALCEVGYVHRLPKVVAASADTLRECIKVFGCGEHASAAISAQSASRGLVKLLDHSSQDVRSAGKALLLEMFLWLGPSILERTLRQDCIKPVMKSELEEACRQLAKHSTVPPGGERMPSRLTRRLERIQHSKTQEKPKTLRAHEEAEHALGIGAKPASSPGADHSPGTLVSDIVSLVQVRVDAEQEGQPQQTLDFYQALGQPKWSVRKSALDSLLERLSELPRIDASQGGRLVAELQRIMAKDANVAVATAAARVTTQLATRADRTLSIYGKPLATAALSRLKEKNRILLEALRAALDALAVNRSVDFAEMTTALVEAATGKVPGARAAALQWCAKLIRTSSAGDLRPALRELKPALSQTAADAVADVREAALECIGLLCSRCGENALVSLIEGLEKTKIDKIQKISRDASQQKAAVPCTTPHRVAAGQPMRRPDAASYLSASIMEDSLELAPKAPASLDAPSATSDSNGSAKARRGLHRNPDHGVIDHAQNKAYPSAGSNLMIRGMASAAPNTALGASDRVDLALPEKIEQDRLLLEQYLENPRLLDEQVMLRQCRGLLQQLHHALEGCQRNGIRTARLASLAETVASLWVSAPSLVACTSILVRLAELGTPALVFACFERLCSEHPGPNAVALSLEFIQSHLIERFGIDSLPIGAVLDITRPLLQEQPSAIREAALRIVARIIREKYAADVQRGLAELTIPAHCQEVLLQWDRENAPPSSMNRTNSDRPDTNKTSTTGIVQRTMQDANAIRKDERVSANPPLSVVSREAPDRETHLEPKYLLALELAAPAILQRLENPNWKLRQDALSDLVRMLDSPNVAVDIRKLPTETLKLLAGRVADTNRNLAVTALNVLTCLGRATTAAARSSTPVRGADDTILRLFLGAVIQHGINDNKKVVREAALACLDSWYSALERNASECRLAFAKYLATALGLELPASRLDTLQWVIERWSGDSQAKALTEPEARLLLEPTLHCLRDKNAQVRQQAERLLELIVRLVGYGTVSSHIRENNNDQARRELVSRLEKFRGMSPARVDAPVPSPRQPSPAISPSKSNRPSVASETQSPTAQAQMGITSPNATVGTERLPPVCPNPSTDFQLDATMQNSESQFAAMLARAKAESASVIASAACSSSPAVMPEPEQTVMPNATRTKPSLIPPAGASTRAVLDARCSDDPERVELHQETFQAPRSSAEYTIAPTPCLPHGRCWRRTADAASGAVNEQSTRLTQILLSSTASNDDRINAAKQLSAVMKDGKWQMLQGHAGDLCLGLVQGIRAILARCNDSNSVDAAAMRVVKYQLNALMHLIMKRELARALSLPALELLIEEVVDRLLDPGVPGYPEGSQLLRAYNLMMLKTLEHVPLILLGRAFVRALRAAVRQSHSWSATEQVTSVSDSTPSRITLLQKCLHRLNGQALSAENAATISADELVQRTIETHLDMLLYELHVLFTQCAVLPAAQAQHTCVEARVLVRVLFAQFGAPVLHTHLRLVPVTVQPYLVRLIDALARSDPQWDRLPLLVQLPSTDATTLAPIDERLNVPETAPLPPKAPPPFPANQCRASPRTQSPEAKAQPSSTIHAETQHIRERLAHLRAQRQYKG